MEKIDVLEIRIEEFKAELSRKNEEAKLIQVMPMHKSSQNS